MEYRGEYLIWGPPGTGKTTFLTRQIERIVEADRDYDPDDGASPVLVCSLTKTAAAEIAGRDLPIPRWQVGTLHAHAYRAIGRPEVAEAHASEWNEEHADFRLGSSVMPDVDEPESEWKQTLMGEVCYARYNVYRARMAPRESWTESVKRFADRWEAWKTERDLIDFTDMIELAWRSTLRGPGSPQVLIADEAQDLSKLEHALLSSWALSAGAIMLAGDPWQSLYTWRGAHPERFTDPEVPKDRVKVLSQSYRVPRVVKAAAMQWAKHLTDYRDLEYTDRGVDGEVGIVPANWKQAEVIVDRAQHWSEHGSVMIAGACSYMLDSVLAILRKRGVPFSNPWRRKRGDWNPLARRRKATTMADRILNFLRPDPATWPGLGDDDHARTWTNREACSWFQLMQSKGILTRGAKKRIQALADDRPAAQDGLETVFDAFVDEVEADKLAAMIFADGKAVTAEMLDWLEPKVIDSRRRASRFPFRVARVRGGGALAEPPNIHVGTIHSFKGAEADTVLLMPDLSPAGTKEWARPGEGRNSVVRMFYVGMTRARERLLLCRPVSGTMSAPLQKAILSS